MKSATPLMLLFCLGVGRCKERSYNKVTGQWNQLEPIPSDDNRGWTNYLEDEISEFHDLPLTWSLNNTVPSWIRGTYVKNGPARKSFADDRYYSNYLDSWGKLHKFTFNGPQVKFSGRMIETANYKKSLESSKMVPTLTLSKVEPIDWLPFELAEMGQNGYDNTNVILWRLGPEDQEKAQYLAATDSPLLHEIDIDTLEVKKIYRFNDPITEEVSASSCAHWRREFNKTSSINYHIMKDQITQKNNFRIYRFANSFEESELVSQFEIPHDTMIHMFGMTVNYAVIVVYPVRVDPAAMPANNFHPMDAIERIEGEPTRIYLVDLRDGSVTDGFSSMDPILTYATHHINAWQENGEVVFDLSCNAWNALAVALNIDEMQTHVDTHEDRANFIAKRVRLDIATKEVTVEDWPNELNIPLLNTVDFPAINMKYEGVKNCFVYGWVDMDYWRNVLVKKDLCDSKNDKTWSRPSHYPGEMWFLPTPGATEEDEGVVLTVVFDGTISQSYLLLLDGKTFQEINYAYLPHNVPFAFHGMWFPEVY